MYERIGQASGAIIGHILAGGRGRQLGSGIGRYFGRRRGKIVN